VATRALLELAAEAAKAFHSRRRTSCLEELTQGHGLCQVLAPTGVCLRRAALRAPSLRCRTLWPTGWLPWAGCCAAARPLLTETALVCTESLITFLLGSSISGARCGAQVRELWWSTPISRRARGVMAEGKRRPCQHLSLVL